MSITRDSINNYLDSLVPLPNGNALTDSGFIALVEWSERQPWWKGFAVKHNLNTGWQTTIMGDPYQFALVLYRFLREVRG